MNVVCDAGYSGGGAWSCNGGSFSGAECLSKNAAVEGDQMSGDAGTFYDRYRLILAHEMPASDREMFAFRDSFSTDIASWTRLHESDIIIDAVDAGSVAIVFHMIADHIATAAALVILNDIVGSSVAGGTVLSFDSAIDSSADSAVAHLAQSGQQPSSPNPPNKIQSDDDTSLVGATVGVVASALSIGIAGLIFVRYRSNGNFAAIAVGGVGESGLPSPVDGGESGRGGVELDGLEVEQVEGTVRNPLNMGTEHAHVAEGEASQSVADDDI